MIGDSVCKIPKKDNFMHHRQHAKNGLLTKHICFEMKKTKNKVHILRFTIILKKY